MSAEFGDYRPISEISRITGISRTTIGHIIENNDIRSITMISRKKYSLADIVDVLER